MVLAALPALSCQAAGGSADHSDAGIDTVNCGHSQLPRPHPSSLLLLFLPHIWLGLRSHGPRNSSVVLSGGGWGLWELQGRQVCRWSAGIVIMVAL